SLQRARQVNAHGTRQLLELALRMPSLQRFVHVSTTFVCGDRAGALVEGPATAGRFRNTYERTKFEAEEAVQRAMATLPVTIVRPSIVGPAFAPAAPDAGSESRLRALHDLPADAARDGHVADPTRGEQARFLLLLRLYLTHGWRWVPGSPTSIV